MEDFVLWCRSKRQQLNSSKTKALVVSFRRTRPHMLPVSIEGVNVEGVQTNKYLGQLLDDRLGWSANSDSLYRKGQSRIYFLWRVDGPSTSVGNSC